MTPLSDAQKQLLFDYSFKLTSGHDSAEAEQLLSTSDEAAELYQLFQSALSPLEALEVEPCPDELSERTIERLKAQAQLASGRSAARADLASLVAAEQVRTIPFRLPSLHNWTEIVAVAAVLVLLVSVLYPAFGFARQKHWQYQCQSNLGDIYAGTIGYMADHNGRLPMVAMAPGSPWWKIGAQGPENHSNTRRAWLLVKEGYVRVDAFICPARRQPRPAALAASQIAAYDDFPGRAYIHFSIRIDCPESPDPALGRKRVFLADLNPLAEALPEDPAASLDIELCEALLGSNSQNHRQRGQNVLLCDGSIEFTTTRHSSFSDDDIYAIKAMYCGQKLRGDERPASNNDTFVAP